MKKMKSFGQFTAGVMVIIMSKMANFLYFLLMAARNQSQFEQKI